ncbi:MAG: class I SAM-dependent methyltransferase [Bdellovibrionales bacterium]|nr:class I SAM-dependent methyltransferase [Bdellovibrionales bacterium]
MESFSRKYLEFLNTELKGLNLTRITDPEEFYNKQVLDSITPLNICPIFKEKINKTKLLVDIGFGGGFPLLPLAKMLPDVKFLGVDTRKKKVLAVEKMANYLGLDNVKVIHERIENIEIDKECVVTYKAVSTVEQCLKWLRPTKSIYCFLYKGPELFEKENLNKLPKNWKKIVQQPYEIPGTKGRIFLGFEGVSSFKKSNSSQVVFLSELIRSL